MNPDDLENMLVKVDGRWILAKDAQLRPEELTEKKLRLLAQESLRNFVDTAGTITDDVGRAQIVYVFKGTRYALHIDPAS